MQYLAMLTDGVATERFRFKSGEITIGRRPENNVVVCEGSVSGYHATIRAIKNKHFPDHSEFLITDRQSTNGVYINGTKINDEEYIRGGDEIKIGWTTFVFCDENEVSNLDATRHMVVAG